MLEARKAGMFRQKIKERPSRRGLLSRPGHQMRLGSGDRESPPVTGFLAPTALRIPATAVGIDWAEQQGTAYRSMIFLLTVRPSNTLKELNKVYLYSSRPIRSSPIQAPLPHSSDFITDGCNHFQQGEKTFPFHIQKKNDKNAKVWL